MHDTCLLTYLLVTMISLICSDFMLVRYDIYRSVQASSSAISKYDLPPPDRYREFFRFVRPVDFHPLSSHCSYFTGCIGDHLVEAITTILPRLLEKHRQTSGDMQSCSLLESNSLCSQTSRP